jgi:peptidoglycan/xylan/chitin deacetylase (PgdA/CDA1 family)
MTFEEKSRKEVLRNSEKQDTNESTSLTQVLFPRINRSIGIVSVALVVLTLLISPSISQSYGTETMCNCVAFRLDDIQDYWLNNVQTEIIETFSRNNVSLTIGIIGNYFGDDQRMVSLIKTRLPSNQTGYAPLELANHGWNHEDFTVFDRAEQSELIAKTSQKVFDLLGVKPSVFIPPLNKLNNDTISALVENQIQYVSANLTAFPISSGALDRVNEDEIADRARVYHFPSTVVTGDLNDDDTEWYTKDHKRILEEIDESIQQYGYAIVTMHPQEFSTREGLNFQNEPDESQIAELELVLENLVQKGEIRLVTISEISNYTVVPEFNEIIFFLIPLIPLSAIVIYYRRVDWSSLRLT